ncbi:hypothetical protein D3C85_1689500 [compost metagenome]
MAEITSAVQVLIAAWQRRRQRGHIKGESPLDRPGIQGVVQLAQRDFERVPVVQSKLQRGRQLTDFHGLAQIAADHQQHTIAARFK